MDNSAGPTTDRNGKFSLALPEGTHTLRARHRSYSYRVAFAGDTLTVTQTIDTAVGSRTMALDSATHKLYLAAAKPNASGGRGNDPATFHVLVFGIK